MRDSLPCNDRRACTVSYAAVARAVCEVDKLYRHRVLSGCSEPSAVPRYAVCHRRAAPHARGLVAPPHPTSSLPPPMVIRHPDGTLLGSMVHVQLARDAIRSCTIHIQSRRLWLVGGWHKASRRSEGLQTIHPALSKAHASPDGSAHQGRSLMDRLIKAPPCKVPKIGSSSRYGSRDRASS